MAESGMNYFPSQAVSDLEKMTNEYGMKVAKAIELEWFNGKASRYNSGNYSQNTRYGDNINSFHNLR